MYIFINGSQFSVKKVWSNTLDVGSAEKHYLDSNCRIYNGNICELKKRGIKEEKYSNGKYILDTCHLDQIVFFFVLRFRMFYIQNALTTSNSAKTACNLGGGGGDIILHKWQA